MEIQEVHVCEECGCAARPLVVIFGAQWCTTCVEENNPE